MQNPLRVVLTGGPCAGKSKALPEITEWLKTQGRHPVVIPEAATLVFGAAGRPDYSNKPRLIDFQKTIIMVQKQMEELFLNTLCLPNSVLIADRGLLDNKTFVYPEDWQHLLQVLNLNENQIGLSRYDAVIHLVTAADGAPAHYKLEGFRNETPEKAIRQDKRLRAVYAGHPIHKIIDNSTNFEGKMLRLKAAFTKILNRFPLEPVPTIEF